MNFDALEDIVKARKAKGLDNWKKLEHLSEKLEGKQSTHITFTTSYPGQEGSKKYLGSATGNLHFLLGYVNPAFHVAPYHWQIVDPNLTDEEAKAKKHPANPRYWQEAGLPLEDEGDLDLGKPHPSTKTSRNSDARRSAKKTGAMTAQSGYGRYVAVPSEGKVYSLTNGHVYSWGIVRESFFAATNPEVTQAMDETYEEGPGEVEKSVVRSLMGPVSKFESDVYPLVKSLFPLPGSVVKVEDKYALLKSNSIEFYDLKGNPSLVEVFDRQYTSFDLTKGGNIHPSILLNFAINYLHVDRADLYNFVHDPTDVPMFAKGEPSPGWEDIPFGEEVNKSLEVHGDTFYIRPVKE